MQKTLFRLALIALFMLMLVMLAGSVVRMTGSGMGCPDWPKCFGYYIPPTDVQTLTWAEGREFRKGQMILKEDAFYVALSDFKTSQQFNAANWEPYIRHDYAIFNPVHTWIEYINRLIGALSGLPVLAFFVLSLFHNKHYRFAALLGGLGVLLLGFAAWLGKLVVDGNLIPHSITYHMFSALALIAIYSFLTARLRPHILTFQARRDPRILWLGGLCIALLLLQIAMGTEVREEVDVLAHDAGILRKAWIDSLSFIFKVHRSFSLSVLASTGIFAFWLIRTRTVSTWPRVLAFVVVFEILAGIGLAYLGMPAILQPLHLMLAVVSFALLVFLMVRYHQLTAKVAQHQA